MPTEQIDRDLISSSPVSEKEVQSDRYLAVNISAGDRDDFEKWIGQHLDAIDQEMRPVISRLQEEENQLEGIMPGGDYPYPGAFRVNYPLTKKKVREIADRIKQAYLDSDPIWAVTLSGDSTEEQIKIAEIIERSMDTAVDHHLEALDDISKFIFDAVHHGCGFIVPDWDVQKATRRRVERWRGFDGVTQASLDEVLAFEDKYTNFRKDTELKRLHARLVRGENVEREFVYKTKVKNGPCLIAVDPQNVRCYPWVDGYTGLKTAPIYGYVKNFRYYELEQMEISGLVDSEGLDRLMKAKDKDHQNPHLQNEEIEVFIGTANYQLRDEAEPYRILFATNEKVLLKIQGFRWWYGEPDLIPGYIRKEEPGFFKRGIAWDLKDDHVVLIVLLNMYLNGADMANSLQLKAKEGSTAARQIIEKRWSAHLPLLWKENPNEVESFQKQLTHLGTIIQGLELMRRTADESTQTTSLQSGVESPRDPTAPATKVALLLQQVAPSEKEYIRSMEAAFRKIGRYVLWLYYQGMKLGWIKEIPGAPQLTADQIEPILDRLNPRALLFEYDRSKESERDLAVLNLIREMAPDPAIISRALKIAISGISSKWAKMIDSLPIEKAVGAKMAPAPGPSQIPGLTIPSGVRQIGPAGVPSTNGA